MDCYHRFSWLMLWHPLIFVELLCHRQLRCTISLSVEWSGRFGYKKIIVFAIESQTCCSNASWSTSIAKRMSNVRLISAGTTFSCIPPFIMVRFIAVTVDKERFDLFQWKFLILICNFFFTVSHFKIRIINQSLCFTFAQIHEFIEHVLHFFAGCICLDEWSMACLTLADQFNG